MSQVKFHNATSYRAKDQTAGIRLHYKSVNTLQKYMNMRTMDMMSKCRLPWWLSGKESACSAGNTGSTLDPGRTHMLQSNEARALQLLSLGAQLLHPRAATRSRCV